MMYLQKKDEEAKQISIPACISCYLGVTEPAMFGVNLKRGFPFLSAMIGSAIAATVSVGMNVMANSIGVGGIPGILSIQPQYMGIFGLCMLIAIAVPFALTVMVGKKRKELYKWRALRNHVFIRSIPSPSGIAMVTGSEI